MKKIFVLIMVLLLTSSVLGAAAEGIDSTTKSLCQIEGHSLTVTEKEWCTRSECSVCDDLTLVFGTVDINGDSVEDIRDLIRLKRYHADNTITVNDCVDVDCNGQKDSGDLAVFRKILLGLY